MIGNLSLKANKNNKKLLYTANKFVITNSIKNPEWIAQNVKCQAHLVKLATGI